LVALLTEHLAALTILCRIHLLIVVALKLVADQLIVALLLPGLAPILLAELLIGALLAAGLLIHVTAAEIIVSHYILSIFSRATHCRQRSIDGARSSREGKYCAPRAGSIAGPPTS
jgi:hypothetical protein